jgi:hypothetical protein
MIIKHGAEELYAEGGSKLLQLLALLLQNPNKI